MTYKTKEYLNDKNVDTNYNMSGLRLQNCRKINNIQIIDLNEEIELVIFSLQFVNLLELHIIGKRVT